MTERISCEESDGLRPNLDPWSSCTNFIDGEVINPELPSHTRTEWCDEDEVVRLIDTLDADGCRHEVPAVVGKEMT
jgi:hypothetical protein